MQGADGWLFLPAELRHVSVGKFWGDDAAKVSKASNPANADPLPAILDFKRQLDAASKLSLGSYDRIALQLPGNPLGLSRDDIIIDGCRGRASGIATSALIAPGRAVMQ